MTIQQRLFWLLVLLLAGCGEEGRKGESQHPANVEKSIQPNILLIVADDLGWSDIGAFGGEIATPNLDKLALSGTRLTNFHVAPTCSPTRSMLLTGTDNHLAGLGNMDEELGPNQKGQPGYEGYLNDRVVSIASLLRDAGYKTMMSGKWHLGDTVELGPESRGFDKVFVLPHGAADHFAQNRVVGMDLNVVKQAHYREDGKRIKLPEDFYSSAHFSDKLIEYIGDHLEAAPERPFFAYAAYTAPHWPLQAPDEFIAGYEGVYEGGYEPIRQARLRKQQAMGLIDESVRLSSLPNWPSWDTLNAQQKAKEVRRMQVYAGMVEALDFHIGRLVDYLQARGQLDNTMVIFMSDNGPEGNDPYHIANNLQWIPANFDNSLENMGRRGSYTAYGPRWAEVGSTPFHLFKGYTSQGGILSPAFITYPGFTAQQQINDRILSVMDIAPTLLAVAGAEHPGEQYKGRAVLPMKGISMLPQLTGQGDDAVEPEDRFLGLELFNRRAVRQGDWKLLWLDPPYGTDSWQLFNLADDPTEQNDLSQQHPEKLTEMKALWQRYAKENNVIIDPDLELGYSGGNSHFQR